MHVILVEFSFVKGNTAKYYFGYITHTLPTIKIHFRGSDVYIMYSKEYMLTFSRTPSQCNDNDNDNDDDQ